MYFSLLLAAANVSKKPKNYSYFAIRQQHLKREGWVPVADSPLVSGLTSSIYGGGSGKRWRGLSLKLLPPFSLQISGFAAGPQLSTLKSQLYLPPFTPSRAISFSSTGKG